MTIDPTKISIPPLPTLPSLNATVPEDVDVQKVASLWLEAFAEAIEANTLERLKCLFVEDSWWRDMLALTWDFRTFRGLSTIITFLRDRVGIMRPKAFKLRPEYVCLERSGQDLAWIRVVFDFETEIGIVFALLRLVPTSDGEWKGHTAYTNLEDLKNFPEKTGALRNPQPNHGYWEDERKREREFESLDPTVLVIGAGHNGLAIAARLKCYEIPTLVVERNERVGDNWRNRYKSLSLHSAICRSSLPDELLQSDEMQGLIICLTFSGSLNGGCVYTFLQVCRFPSTWPKYTPADKVLIFPKIYNSDSYCKQLANWLESYAESLELNVWTSSTVAKASQDSITKRWNITVRRADGSNRIFNVKHVMFATGFDGIEPNIPKFHNMVKIINQGIFIRLTHFTGTVQRTIPPLH